jgi:hypothetical protein
MYFPIEILDLIFSFNGEPKLRELSSECKRIAEPHICVNLSPDNYKSCKLDLSKFKLRVSAFGNWLNSDLYSNVIEIHGFNREGPGLTRIDLRITKANFPNLRLVSATPICGIDRQHVPVAGLEIESNVKIQGRFIFYEHYLH